MAAIETERATTHWADPNRAVLARRVNQTPLEPTVVNVPAIRYLRDAERNVITHKRGLFRVVKTHQSVGNGQRGKVKSIAAEDFLAICDGSIDSPKLADWTLDDIIEAGRLFAERYADTGYALTVIADACVLACAAHLGAASFDLLAAEQFLVPEAG